MLKTLFIFSLFPLVCFSQNDTLNQSINKKKNGFWKVYLDSSLNQVKDESAAFFVAYEQYDMNDKIFKYYKNPFSKEDSVSYNLKWPKKGKPQILTGEFYWYTLDGRTLGHQEYINGNPWYMSSFSYYKKDPQKCGHKEILDWSKPHNGISGTFYYAEYWDDEIDRYGWFRKGKRGWRVYLEKK
jgi:hypothetical protein|tara:strand:+ start:818 stop:1369 length:552 start_codon:yes stop_codon:yes gene_type:complete